jgi:hypothetical protein
MELRLYWFVCVHHRLRCTRNKVLVVQSERYSWPSGKRVSEMMPNPGLQATADQADDVRFASVGRRA